MPPLLLSFLVPLLWSFSNVQLALPSTSSPCVSGLCATRPVSLTQAVLDFLPAHRKSSLASHSSNPRFCLFGLLHHWQLSLALATFWHHGASSVVSWALFGSLASGISWWRTCCPNDLKKDCDLQQVRQLDQLLEASAWLPLAKPLFRLRLGTLQRLGCARASFEIVDSARQTASTAGFASSVSPLLAACASLLGSRQVCPRLTSSYFSLWSILSALPDLGFA